MPVSSRSGRTEESKDTHYVARKCKAIATILGRWLFQVRTNIAEYGGGHLTASMQANNVFEMAHESEERLLKRLSPGADTSGSGQTGSRERATKHALHSCACVCMHTCVAPSVFVTDIDTARDSSCW